MSFSEILDLALQHLILVVFAVLGASLIGIPVGVILSRKPSLQKPVLGLTNIVQTIPSLAFFGFLIPLLGRHGIGVLPALIALFLYSLLPVIQNTLNGILSIEPSIRESAVAMGMTPLQVILQVELPLALSVIFAGIRIATVIAIGTATIAAAIGAGGLGVLIFRGLRMNDNRLILEGAVPAALMALLADYVLGRIQQSLSVKSRGNRHSLKTLAVLGGFVLIFFGFYAVHFNFNFNFHFNIRGANSLGKKDKVVVGCKDFTEQILLGEMLAQWIEKKSQLKVERRFELGGDLCHRALLNGNIDMYVEYTGTALTAILKHAPISDSKKVYDKVKSEYASRYGLRWLEPLGFNDTFAILVRHDDAIRFHLKNISDLIPVALHWRAGFGQDFMSRKDGYDGFIKSYPLHFAEPPREMDLSLSYRALKDHQVDVIAGNSTDGTIKQLNLVQLVDDRHYFPPYEAAPVVREYALKRHPELLGILNQLAGRVSNQAMQELNNAVDEQYRKPDDVVRDFLQKGF